MNVPESNFVPSCRVITFNSEVIAGYSCQLDRFGCGGSHGCLTAGKVLGSVPAQAFRGGGDKFFPQLCWCSSRRTLLETVSVSDVVMNR